MTYSNGASPLHDGYARAALNRECELAASAGQGRNEQLNRSAFSIGQFVGAGLLDRSEVEHRLMAAAHASGYIAKDGRPAAQATIRSGLDQGQRQPRTVPDASHRNGHSHGHAGRSDSVQQAPRPAPSLDDLPLPAWSEPGLEGRPRFIAIGQDEPGRLPNELRRHHYRRAGQTVRVKIKQDGDPMWVDVYRVAHPDARTGWQAKKPAGYVPVPYGNAFDRDLNGDTVVWAEGERDCDSLIQLGFASFTFGSASDVPPGVEDLLVGRDVVVIGDNDEAGRKFVGRVAERLKPKAKRIRALVLDELPEGGDISDFAATGGTAEQLLARIDAIEAERQTPPNDGEEPWMAPPPEEAPGSEPQVRLKRVDVFLDEYVPLSYAMEPIVRTGALYTLTAKTGSGKTALLISTALAICTGRRDLIGMEVQQGRVAFLTFENPDDVRMRLKVSCYLLNVTISEIADKLLILDLRASPEAVLAELKRAADESPFTMVFVDTLAAMFDGTDANDAVQGGNFLRRLRPMTHVAGSPSVVVASHPTKNAMQDQLVPYGSGAILNEVDGNLTLWRKPDTGTVELHWQGKLRGLEFEPIQFRFEISTCPDVRDAKGREVSLPTLMPVRRTEADEEANAQADADINVALLKAMVANPKGPQREWGMKVNRSVSVVNKKLQHLKSERVVEVVMGRWSVTPKGEKELEKWA